MRAMIWILTGVGLLACTGRPPGEGPAAQKPPGGATSSRPAEILPPGGAGVVRHTVGSDFQKDDKEPLPRGAVARCGTTRMRATNAGPMVITDTGRIWTVDTLSDSFFWALRDLENGVDVRIHAGSPSAIAPDGSFLVLPARAEPGALLPETAVELLSTTGGSLLGKVELPQAPSSGKARSGVARLDDLFVAPGGQRVVAATSDGMAHVIDAASRKVVKSLRLPVGSHLVSVSAGAERGLLEQMDEGHQHAWEHELATGYLVLDLRSGAEVYKETFPPATQGFDPVHGQAFHRLSPDGIRVYRSERGAFSVIALPSGKETPLGTLPPVSGVLASTSRRRAFEISGDGRRAIESSRLVELSEGAAPRIVPGNFAAISPDGRWTVTRSEYFGKYYERQPTPVTIPPGHQTAVRQLAFEANSDLVSLSDETIFWDTRTCTPRNGPTVLAWSVAAAPEKWLSFFGAGGNGAGPLLVDGGMTVLAMPEPHDAAHVAAFSPRGDLLALGMGDEFSEDGTVVLDRLEGTRVQERHERKLGAPAQSVAVSPDGTRAAVLTGGKYGKEQPALSLLSLPDLATLTSLPAGSSGAVAFAGPDRLIHADFHGRVAVRDLPGLGLSARILESYQAAAVSADGRLLAGAAYHGLVIWNLEQRKMVGRMTHAHREDIQAVAFSPDGRFVATGSLDTSVLLWDVSQIPAPALVEKVEPPITDAAERKRFAEAPPDDWTFRILPDGSLAAPRAEPKRLLPPLRNVRRVTQTNDAACAIAQGKVRCWGNPAKGLLGASGEKGKAGPRTTPTTLAATDPVDVQMSSWQGCALERGGDLLCWGRIAPGGATSPATRVLQGVKSFDLDTSEPCAVGTGGALWCWSEEDPVPRLRSLKDVVQLAMGLYHQCALTRAGAVWCAGGNGFDEVGDEAGLPRADFVQVKGVEGAVALTAYSSGTCASTSSGKVLCWGSIDDAHLPAVTRIHALDGATAVRIERFRVCGLFGDRIERVRFLEGEAPP